MRKTLTLAVAAVIGITGVLTGTETASAQAGTTKSAPPTSLDQVRGQALAALAAGDIENVRDRRARGDRRWRGGRHYRDRRHYGGRRYYRDRRYYGGRRYYRDRRDRGGYLAAGALGLAAGAIIAGSAANNRAYARGDSYCARRFRSYNPNTGTYTAYDGRQVACP